MRVPVTERCWSAPPVGYHSQCSGVLRCCFGRCQFSRASAVVRVLQTFVFRDSVLPARVLLACNAPACCLAASLLFFKAKGRTFKARLTDDELRRIARGTAGLTYRQLNDIWVSAVDRCNEEAIAAARRNHTMLDRNKVRPVVYADLEKGFNIEQQDAPVDLWCPCTVCKTK